MAKGRNLRGPYSRPSRSSSSPSSCQASCGRRRGLASMQPRANAASGGGQPVADQLGHAGAWPARCRCRARRAAGASISGGYQSRYRATTAGSGCSRAGPSSTSRPGRGRARPDGSARARAARRRGPRPARCAAPSATSSRRHIHAASRGSTPPGKAARTWARLTKPSSAPSRLRAPLGAGARIDHPPRAREPGEVGAEPRLAAEPDPAQRRGLAVHQVVVGRIPGQLQQAAAGLVQVGHVAAGDQRPAAIAVAQVPLPERGQPGERGRRAGIAGRASGWVSLASRR